MLELAGIYHERWEIESVFDEFKTHMGASSTVLRSKTPDLVEQELWGLLMAHFAIRQLMNEAAWEQELDPDRLSFVHAVRVVKRKMPQAAGCVSSRGLHNPRGVKRKMSSYAVRHRGELLNQRHTPTPVARI